MVQGFASVSVRTAEGDIMSAQGGNSSLMCLQFKCVTVQLELSLYRCVGIVG